MAGRKDATYDILTGAPLSPAPQQRQPLRETFKQSTVSRPDVNNENLRAQLNTLQYELDSIKQERELKELQQQQELRDLENRAESDFKKAQAAEAAKNAATKKADQLTREWQDMQDRGTNEKAALEKKVRGLQDENRSMREDLEDAQAQVQEQERQSRHAYDELQSKYATLQGSVEGIQQDLEGRVNALQSTQQKLVQKEAKVGELEDEVLRLKAQTGDSDTLAVIKKELSEQVAYIKKLETQNREHVQELKQFRKNQKSIEVVEEEKHALESRLKVMDDLSRELAEAQLQKRILEDEKKGWTSYLENETNDEDDMKYDTPEEMAKAFLRERMERLSLVDKLGSVQPELSVKDEEIQRLRDEKNRLNTEMEQLRSAGTSVASAVTVADAKAKARLERQKNLMAKEVDHLRAQMKAFEAEEAEFNPEKANEDHAKRVNELEEMLVQYRSELSTLHADLSKLEAQPPTPAAAQSPKKRSHSELESDDERLGELKRKMRTLQTSLDELQTRNSILEAELKASTTQIASLKESSRTRVLEFRNNPTAEVEAIKMATLRTLREENAALLTQLENKPTPGKVVPVSTLENLRLQMSDLQTQLKQGEKKTLRLKQIFSTKSLEFREAVASILGWTLEFMPNGRVKASSILYPHLVNEEGEKEENSIVFDGENGTMKVSGGPQSVFAGEIRQLIEYWVEG